MESLKQKRGRLKMRITSFKNFLTNAVPTRLPEGYDPSQAIPQIIKFEIENRITKLSDITYEFYKIQDSIEETINDEDHSDILKYREEFENEYFAITAQAQQLLARGQVTHVSSTNQNIQSQKPIANTSQSAQVLFTVPKRPSVKLPTIELQKFGGELESWLGFRDTFRSLIHDNNSLGNVKKFHYLKSSVKGKAEELIKSIEI